uniref:Uncharacterized protein n=1 Tax=Callorhinchus milii TaxID=7868 RepID=A0A4W3GFE1_CALMI
MCDEPSPIPAPDPQPKKRQQSLPSYLNLGNPVFSYTSQLSTPSPTSYPFVNPQHPLFKTTSAEYGSNPPTCETAPTTHNPLTQAFSEPLRNAGMYRNSSMNTYLDKSKVLDCMSF